MSVLTRASALLVLLPLIGCGDDSSSPSEPTLDAGVVIIPDAVDSDAPVLGGEDAVGDTSGSPATPWRLVTAPGAGEGRIDATFADCLYASPVAYASPSRGDEVIVAGGDVVIGVDPATGETRWTVELAEQDGLRAFAAGTPALHENLLLVGYALRDVGESVNVLSPEATGADAGFARQSHWVAVVDVEAGTLDPRMPAVELSGSVTGSAGGQVAFLPSNAFMRAELGWWGATDTTLGFGYAQFGNVRDLQPWHGWAFEVDFDAWLAGDPPISGRFATTTEENCGAPGASGSFQRVCGGGLWSPSGAIAVPADNEAGFDVILAPGNGQLDITDGNFANTLLRVSPGLDFVPDCDEALCADFDPDAPSLACITSCTNVFVPRLRADETELRMPDGRCDGLSFFECWAAADYIGGSTPLLTEAPSGERVLVYPTKDGHAYLVDADNLGTMYDRHPLVEYCGTVDDPCRWSWSGMIVNEPVETTTLETPRILVATFMPDNTNPAGVVAVSVVDTDDGPRLERQWEFPNFSDPAAVSRFRIHPSRVQLAVFNGLEVAIVVEPAPAFQQGRAYVLRASDGALLAEVPLAGPGYRFTQPLVLGDQVFINSCDSDNGTGTLETVQLIVEPVTP